MRFVSAEYWDLIGTFCQPGSEAFNAELISVDGRKIPSGRDFDASTGQIKDASLLLLDARQAAELAQRLLRADARVADLEDRPDTLRPYPPFTTSTLQQEANRKFGFSARQTMQVAQNLYENGFITYMRTDSTTLASVAVQAARGIWSRRSTAVSICRRNRGSIRPKSRTPRRPTRRSGPPAIHSRCPTRYVRA